MSIRAGPGTDPSGLVCLTHRMHLLMFQLYVSRSRTGLSKTLKMLALLFACENDTEKPLLMSCH